MSERLRRRSRIALLLRLQLASQESEAVAKPASTNW